MRTLDQTTPIARKEHRCIWCGEMILKGEKYTRWVGMADGFQSNPFHIECSGESEGEDFDAYNGERPAKEKP